MNPRLVAVMVTVMVAALLTAPGCDPDPLRVDPSSIASPAAAPKPTVSPAGTVWRVPGTGSRAGEASPWIR